MEIQQMTVGCNRVNCYILFDRETHEASCIDPGGDAARIVTFLRERSLNLKNIFLTHGHFDHILGVQQVKAATGARVVISKLDSPCLSNPGLALYNSIMREPFRKILPDICLYGDERTVVCGKDMLFVATPGHSSGSMCMFIDDILFSGDTLFADGVGRSDFPTSSTEQLCASLRYLYGLPREYRILPGHGGPTTLSEAKADNRDFVDLATRGRTL